MKKENEMSVITELNEKYSFSSSNTHHMSDDIRELAKAFLLAKMTMGGAKKESKSNQHKYANIDAVYEAVEPALYSNNIIIWHFAERLDDEHSVLHTRLIHAPTGQYVQDTRALKSEKPGNQAVGSANTYMRRYAVLSLCALSTDDDDGKSEQDYIDKTKNKQQTPKKITASQCTNLINFIENNPEYDPEDWTKDIKKQNRIKELDELTEAQYFSILNTKFK